VSPGSVPGGIDNGCDCFQNWGMVDDVEHSSIRFARATRAIRHLTLAECIELLQLVEGAPGEWGKFEPALAEHGVDRNREDDKHALRISLLIRRMDLEKDQIEKGKKHPSGDG